MRGGCRLQSCDAVTVQGEPGNVSPCLYMSTTSTSQEQHSKLTREGSSDTPGSGANEGSACPGPATSLCPPTPFPTRSGQKREQELARMALGACKYRQGVPCELGVPHLTFSGLFSTAWQCQALHGGSTPSLPLAREEMTHSRWSRDGLGAWRNPLLAPCSGWQGFAQLPAPVPLVNP